MQANLLILIFASLILAGCIGGEDTSNKIQADAQTKAQQQSYEIQLTSDWIKDAKVVDSNNQQASYKGKGIYSFRNKPQGSITLIGGTFEKTGLANKMVMRAEANSKTLSTMDSFFYQYPHLKNKMLNALDSKYGSQKARYNTEKIIYLMASNNLLNQFSNSLKNVKSYSDIVASARSSSSSSANANAIGVSLLMISLSFFDITKAEHIASIKPNRRYITQNGSGDKSGVSWAHAYDGAQLQRAINELANAKGEVWIAEGIYKPGTSESDFFELKDGVKLYGGFAGHEASLIDRDNVSSVKTVLSGDIDNNDARRTADGITNSYRDIVGRNSQTVIKLKDATDDNTRIDRVYITGGASDIADKAGGLTLKNAKVTLKDIYFFGNKSTAASASSTTGGAIRAEGSTLIIDNAAFKRNYAHYGGAIANKDSSLNINNAKFDNNWADFGGAISSKDAAGTASIKNTSFKGNHANKSGGALYNISSNHTINNAAFINNFATNSGGALYNRASSNTLNKITFYGNRVQRDDSQALRVPGAGGAIYNESGSNSTITNATFAYNTNFSANTDAQPKGGAIYNHNSAPKLINCTFVYNRTRNAGGGAMYTTDNSSSTGKPMLVNSILWHNKHPSNNNWEQYNHNTDATTNNVAYAGTDSHINRNPGSPTPTPIFKKVKQTTAGVKHIYYQLKTALTGALASGSRTVNSTTVTIPDKDQVNTPRNTSGVSNNKGAIQAADANISGATSQPFIKSITHSQSGSQVTVTIIFSDPMFNIATSNNLAQILKVQDAAGNPVSPTPAITRQTDTKKYQIVMTTQSGEWYSITVTTEVLKESPNTPLNRNYIYEFKAN